MRRWLIEGSLTTVSPLHVGSGEAVERGVTRTRPDGTREPVEVAGVVMDHEGRPYIPGSSLKGVLRAWLAARNVQGIEQVFGSAHPGATSAAGRAQFRGASAISEAVTFKSRHWHSQSMTDVVAGVALDRRTRTASDERLFHAEIVPPGVEFRVRVEGRDLEDDQVSMLLGALTGFDDPACSVALGSGTRDGWGRCTWAPKRVVEVDTAAVAKWINAGGGAAREGSEYEHEIWSHSRDRMDLVAGLSRPGSPRPVVEAEIELSFEGGFLVNDPRQTEDAGSPAPGGRDRRPDHVPLWDERGDHWAYLPASSFRGAFRAQAERIFRTLGGTTPVESGDPRTLDLVSKVFGSPGWSAPLEVGDFVQPRGGTPAPVQCQEFVAIDRFTGGGAEHLKFNARRAVRPVLCGRLKLDLERVAKADAGPSALGLLALTLRDLCEGDITFGFGAAKGYGACRATILTLKTPPHALIPSGLREGLTADGVASLERGLPPRDSDIAQAVAVWVDALCKGAPAVSAGGAR